jgi:hypothetical protein
MASSGRLFFAMQKAILGTGRPLTIACHMKILPDINIRFGHYLVVEVSDGTVVEVESTGDMVVDVSTVEPVESLVEAPPSVVSLHATNALIARTNKNFFICN